MYKLYNSTPSEEDILRLLTNKHVNNKGEKSNQKIAGIYFPAFVVCSPAYCAIIDIGTFNLGYSKCFQISNFLNFIKKKIILENNLKFIL